MPGLGRYARLLLAFARFGLATELAFRANFLVKVFVEVLWLAILLVFGEECLAGQRWRHDAFRCFEREAAGEDRKAAKDQPLQWGQQTITPVDRRATQRGVD